MATELSKEEKKFCELYVNGTAPYAGNATRCYAEVFHDNSMQTKHLALQMIGRVDIQEYLKELDGMAYEEAKYMKKFLTESLVHIIEETSTAEFTDRRGVPLSPAPLRSVAVGATKALMEMYPVREAQVNKLNIEGNGEGGITFNVIVPEQKPKEANT
jgi:hypothetical protein